MGGKAITKIGTRDCGAVQWYYDPLPTNCVAAWVCPECEGLQTRRSRRLLVTAARKNLAVFYESCTFDCLFCQNWHYRDGFRKPNVYSAQELADACDEETACICFFGGDPASQMGHALATANTARERQPGFRVCWETNGSAAWGWMKKAAELSLESGGIVKFDLKARDENLHLALTGSSNRNTFENFRRVAEMGRSRTEPPLVLGSTLLVPGYVEEEEVESIARYITDIDPAIPYSLLGFHPDYCFFDLPVTSRKMAERCAQVCRDVGLKRVHLGNRHLLA
jgi:pyruvate formate lyase activating enzyme